MNLGRLGEFTNLNSIKDAVAGAVGDIGQELAERKLKELAQQLGERLSSAIRDNGLDPLPLPEAEVPFTAWLLCLPLSSTATIGAGDIKGLATVHQEVEVEVDGSVATVRLQLRLGSVCGGADAAVSMGCWSLSPRLRIDCEPVTLHVHLEADLKAKSVALKELKVEEVPQVATKVTNVSNSWLRGRLAPLARQVAETERNRLVELATARLRPMVEELAAEAGQLRSLF